MKLLFSLCLCPLLTACLTTEERMEAARQRNDARDDAKRQSSGAKPSEAAYVRCRQQLDAARIERGFFDMRYLYKIAGRLVSGFVEASAGVSRCRPRSGWRYGDEAWQGRNHAQ
jgi:hypothetical protein